MNAKVKHLRKFVVALANKFNEETSLTGLESVCDQLKFSSNYLYKRIWSPISKLDDEETIGLNLNTLNRFAREGLTLKSYADFVQSVEHTLDDQLLSLTGKYLCYVRMSATRTTILQSPAQISVHNREFIFELSGPRMKYTGAIESRNGCMFVLMRSKEGKAFFHTYKIGHGKAPVVLKGIFSGVSTAFDPIGGRAVLIRCAKDVPMKNIAYTISDLRTSKIYAAKELSEYFKNYEGNNLKPGDAVAFDKADLV